MNHVVHLMESVMSASCLLSTKTVERLECGVESALKEMMITNLFKQNHLHLLVLPAVKPILPDLSSTLFKRRVLGTLDLRLLIV